MDVLALLGPQAGLILIASLAGLGLLAGFLAGLLGVGGGIVLVPGLLFVFHLVGLDSVSLIHVCVGTSLALIIPNGLMSARKHWQKGAVDFTLVRQIGPGIVIGTGLGAVLADHLSGPALMMIFSTAVILLAGLMASNPTRFKFLQRVPDQPWPGLTGIGIGTISTLIGIGGGSLSVPYLTLCGVPIHRAIGTAAALGVVIAIPATLGFILIGLNEAGRPPFSLGYVNGLAALGVLPFSLLAVPLGVKAAHFAPVHIMRRIFAVFLVIVALKLWAEIL